MSDCRGRCWCPSASGAPGLGNMSEDKPPALCAYDIPLPRERSRTFPSVDFHLWTARHRLLGSDVTNPDVMSVRPASSEANSLAGSWESLSHCESFPPALCVYDIPLPCGHFRSWEEVCGLTTLGLQATLGDTPPAHRKRSMTMPATDLKKLREKNRAKTRVCANDKVG